MRVRGLWLGWVGLLPWVALATALSLSVDHARITDAPPGASMRVGYLDLHNDGDRAIRITGADSADFERVEMHQTVVEQGMARMRALTEVSVPAHGGFAFAPGAAHLMLIAPKRPLIAGDRVRLHLLLDSGERLPVDLAVLGREDAR